jgi:hypothetical protein
MIVCLFRSIRVLVCMIKEYQLALVLKSSLSFFVYFTESTVIFFSLLLHAVGFVSIVIITSTMISGYIVLKPELITSTYLRRDYW